VGSIRRVSFMRHAVDRGQRVGEGERETVSENRERNDMLLLLDGDLCM
jgi:hypothetical protein